MVSALDSRSGSLGSSPGKDTMLSSWARHFTLIVPFSNQNLLLGVTLQWTNVPSKGE